MLNRSLIEASQAQLLQLRAELEDLRARAHGAGAPVELDPSKVGRLSRMDALQVQAMALDTERRRNLELRRIASALERIAQGGYGYCVSCEEEIAFRRLQNNPAVPTCIHCAKG